MRLPNPQLREELYCSGEGWHETGWEQPGVLGLAGVTHKRPAHDAADLT